MGDWCLRVGSMVGVVSALACSAEVDDYGSDAAVGSTHALITVERSTTVDPRGGSSAEALAGFVRVPAEVDAKLAMQLLGLEFDLPPADTCRTLQTNDPSVPLAGMGRIEFLEAGKVVLQAGEAATDLAPRAFPTVTDLISGVMYTTRGRTAEPLPAGASYTLRTTGGVEVPPVAAAAEAPDTLSGVTLQGIPLGDVSSVATDIPQDLTWNVGRPGDTVWVQLSTPGKSDTVCVFRDDAGVGTIPAKAFSGQGTGRFAMHRQRTVAFTAAGLNRGVVRFDFQVSTAVDYAARP